jgi:pyrroline-5-carboxylate reductase
VTHTGEQSVAAASDIVFLAVKPNHMESVLRSCACAPSEGKIYVTLAVGLPLSLYVRFFGEQAKVVRTMPNTPALIGEGITLYCCTPAVLPEEKRIVASLLETAGMVEELEERLMSEVTAVTSSSPAFFFMMIEAMGDAAVLSGIPRASAYRWAAAAMAGSARLLLKSGKHPGELKDMVTSPGGTTIEGLAVLEREGFRSAIIDAMGAVTGKARAIGESRQHAAGGKDDSH